VKSSIKVEEVPQEKLNKGEQIELCKTHHAKLSYICLTCIEEICADCAMLDERHKNHEVESIEKVYKEKTTEMKEELHNLDQNLESLQSQLEAVELNLNQVKKNHQLKTSELKTTSEQMNRRLENELINKLNCLNIQKKDLHNGISTLRQIRGETERQMHISPKNHFILKSDGILEKVRKEKEKTLKVKKDNEVDFEFPSEIVPEFLTSVFVLKHSSYYQNGEFVYSEPIRSCGASWRLKVYPKGNLTSVGNLSVFLEVLEGTQNQARYEYKIELINQRNPNGPHFCKEFIYENQIKDCLGYSKFFKTSLLEEEGFILPEQDQIVFKYAIRVPTYHEKCNEQEKYIKLLENKNKETLEKMAELERKLDLEIKEKERLLKLCTNNIQVNISEDLLGLDEHKFETKNQTKISEGSYLKSERSTNNEEFFEENSPNIIYQRRVTDSSLQCDSKDLDMLQGIKDNILRQDSEEVANEVDIDHHFEVVDEHDQSFQDLSSSSIEEDCEENEENPIKFSEVTDDLVISMNNETNQDPKIMSFERANYEENDDLLLSLHVPQH